MMKLVAAAAVLATLSFAAPARAETADLALGPTLQKMELSLQLSAADVVRAEKPTTLFGLPKNIRPVDRGIRLALAATLVGVGAYRLSNDSPNRGLSWAMVGVAAVPAATGAIGYCPLYQLLGIDNTF